MRALSALSLLLGCIILANPVAAQLPAPPATLGLSAERLARIDRVMQQYVDSEARIFRPLKMTDSHFFLPESKQNRLTAVYAARDQWLERAPDGPDGQGDYVGGPGLSYAGGAGLVSTARDYARFLQMLLNGGSLDGARILGPRTVRLMLSDHADSTYSAPGLDFGLGFEILEDPGLAGQYGGVGRFGWGGAYATNYWADPSEDLVAVFMIQLLPSRGLDLGAKFRTLVYQAIVR